MLVRELIQRLNDIDPTGELEVIVSDDSGDDGGCIVTGVDEDTVAIFSDNDDDDFGMTSKKVILIEFGSDEDEQYAFIN